VWAANGSNEVMLQILQAFGGPGRVAVSFAPTYSMYPEYARDAMTGWVVGHREDDFSLDVEHAVDVIKEHQPTVVLLPSPNNPTGTALPPETVTAVCEAAPGVVVIDEAYGEFRRAGVPSALELLPAHRNLVVTRTMSKAFALAGARLGYLAADPAICDGIRRDLVSRGIPEERITIIPNGVDTRKYAPRARDESLADRYGLGGKIVIAYVGTLFRFEGVSLLLDALHHLIESDDRIRGLIVGHGEATAELQQELLNLRNQCILEFALLELRPELQEVEDLRVPDELLRKLGLWLRQSDGEVRHRGTLALDEPTLDVVDEDIAAPAVLDGGLGIPSTFLWLLNPVEQHLVVAPWNLCSNLLHKFGVGPGHSEGPHVLEVAHREAGHLGEGAAQVLREPVDHLRSPPLMLLAAQDVAAELPVQQHHLPVGGDGRARLRLSDALLHRGEPALVADREGRVGYDVFAGRGGLLFWHGGYFRRPWAIPSCT